MEVEPRTRASGRDFPTDWANLSSTIRGTAPYFPAEMVLFGAFAADFDSFSRLLAGQSFLRVPRLELNGQPDFALRPRPDYSEQAGAEVPKQAEK